MTREQEMRQAVADATARRLNAGEAGEHAARIARIQRRIRGEQEPEAVATPSAAGAYTNVRREP